MPVDVKVSVKFYHGLVKAAPRLLLEGIGEKDVPIYPPFFDESSSQKRTNTLAVSWCLRGTDSDMIVMDPYGVNTNAKFTVSTCAGIENCISLSHTLRGHRSPRWYSNR